ncbi:MAG TPA: cytochrome P450, partial [Arachnia sp.]|nr:cytochrome P450 [Arachnia sp.]
DAVAQFADPLAARILGRFLGLPERDYPALSNWGKRLSVHLDPFAIPDASLAAEREEMLLLFADLMYEPEDPLGALTLLARSHSAGRATAHEILETAALMVIGGLEPLASLIAAALAARIGSGEFDRLERVRTTAEEILRYDSPIPFTARRATSDVQLGVDLIPAGENVVVLLGAANHDPARFTDPDEFDASRRTNPHLAFGAGRHVCLGAPLVRLVGDALVRCFGRPFPDLVIVAAATKRRSSTVPRAYATLGVRLR